MQIKLDVKTLVLGIAIGALVTIAMGINGAGSADASRFGIAVPNQGFAVVTNNNGDLFIVEGKNPKAKAVRYDTGPLKGRDFNLTPPTRQPKSSSRERQY